MHKLVNSLRFKRPWGLENKLITRYIQQYSPDHEEEIVQKVFGNFVNIGINIPETKNVLTETALEKLHYCIKSFESNDEISSAVLHGNGGNFCSGIVETNDAAELGQNLLKMLHTLKKPIVGSLNGYTRGFGLSLAIMCDIRIMEEQALLGFYEKDQKPEIPTFLYDRLVLTIGLSRTVELICTKAMWSASDCLTSGLANRITDVGSGLGQAMVWAQSIAFTNPLEAIVEHKTKISSVLPKKLNE